MAANGETNRLPESAHGALHAFWDRVVAQESEERLRDQLRLVACSISAIARSADLLPEQLIIAIKESWLSHAGLRDPDLLHVRGWMLPELITLTIREFYRDDVVLPRHAPIVPRLEPARDRQDERPMLA